MNDRFRPVLIGGKEAKVTGEIPAGKPTIKDELLALLETLKTGVEAGEIAGLIAIIIDEDGDQDEVAVTNENDYSMLGRITAMQSSMSLGIGSYDEEDFEDI